MKLSVFLILYRLLKFESRIQVPESQFRCRLALKQKTHTAFRHLVKCFSKEKTKAISD